MLNILTEFYLYGTITSKGDVVMGYTKSDILAMCDENIKNINTFYKADCINYRGKCSDTGELFTEVVAEFVLDHLQEFKNNITQITRSSSYKIKGHDGIHNMNTNRAEEHIAVDMYNFCDKNGGNFDHIGKIIDYQTPLKSSQDDAAGKIDLISYDGEILRILELKKPDTKETMLRCVMEGYTYLKTVDSRKLLEDFCLPMDTVIKACPFVFSDSIPYKEYKEQRPQLSALMTALDSKPYFISENNSTYIITED
ncbi:MAG: hypothetical protein K2G87_12345 [Oscillospiraceae bacterium]|nr:hypothetical protein [Oscillospiraceae bacterium]